MNRKELAFEVLDKVELHVASLSSMEHERQRYEDLSTAYDALMVDYQESQAVVDRFEDVIDRMVQWARRLGLEVSDLDDLDDEDVDMDLDDFETVMLEADAASQPLATVATSGYAVTEPVAEPDPTPLPSVTAAVVS